MDQHDHDRFSDDGNPHDPIEPIGNVEAAVHHIVHDLFTPIETLSKVHRRHRMLIHGAVILTIAVSLYLERRWSGADWMGVAMMVLCEVQS